MVDYTMSDLVTYKEKYVPKGQGFINLGATCYFNSLLQCILSCPAIYEVLDSIKDKDHVKRNSLAQNLLKLWNNALAGQSIFEIGIPIWRDILAISQSQKNQVRMDAGQQDAHEGLMMFLDAMETIPEVHRLFQHRHNIRILCTKCGKIVADNREFNMVFVAQPDLKTPQHEKFKDVDEYYNRSMPLNEFLRKQNGYIDKDYVCPNPECKDKSEKFQTTTLSMIPEIIPVVLKKYIEKVPTPFPARLEFLAKGGTKKYIYKLVAQSEHSGSMSGGHYWATGLRSDGWKSLNDGNVSDTTPGPTNNTYIIFYNYVGEETVVV